METTTTTAGYQVKGITEDITTCDCCGRQDLMRTVCISILDADGNHEAFTHYGTGCAASWVSVHYGTSKVAFTREVRKAQGDACQTFRYLASKLEAPIQTARGRFNSFKQGAFAEFDGVSASATDAGFFQFAAVQVAAWAQQLKETRALIKDDVAKNWQLADVDHVLDAAREQYGEYMNKYNRRLSDGTKIT